MLQEDDQESRVNILKSGCLRLLLYNKNQLNKKQRQLPYFGFRFVSHLCVFGAIYFSPSKVSCIKRSALSPPTTHWNLWIFLKMTKLELKNWRKNVNFLRKRTNMQKKSSGNKEKQFSVKKILHICSQKRISHKKILLWLWKSQYFWDLYLYPRSETEGWILLAYTNTYVYFQNYKINCHITEEGPGVNPKCVTSYYWHPISPTFFFDYACYWK